MVIDGTWVLALPRWLEFMLVAYKDTTDVFVAVHICEKIKQRMGKDKDWRLVFISPKNRVSMAGTYGYGSPTVTLQ